MKVRLIAVGTRMPAWVESGVAEFQPRLPREWRFEIVEIPVATRGSNADIARLKTAEGEKILRQVPAGAEIIAFDERGESLDTMGWAKAVQGWQRDGRDVALLIGGPDGLAPEVLSRAQRRWSLSKLTLPHALVRVMVLEQLYRAWSVNAGHPYHRP
ncbi:MAG TPA: 23S rRNA (pseudouridine(1915)-N(3))-methyltransferase RlmH [Verrucomicrobiae bacterium]|nr:23S rRNA (pseudouridine(1915)-N(3))-methyltransferase RlmH [Verrucomicrobiae bacterium]